MLVLIDEMRIPSEQFTSRTFHFGREVTDQLPHNYRLVLDIEEFRQAIGESFTTFVLDCHNDDKKNGILELIPELVANNYRDFSYFLANDPVGLCHVIREYLIPELFDEIIRHDPRKALYFANTVDSIEVHEAEVSISGLAYLTPKQKRPWYKFW